MNENSKNNKYNSETSTRYRRIHILTAAPKGVTKTKAPYITRKAFLSVRMLYFTAVIALSLEKANL